MAVLTITEKNFQEEVLNSDKTVLIDFWASWWLASAFGIMSIPTLVVMKDGKVVNSSVGVRPKGDILRML